MSEDSAKGENGRRSPNLVGSILKANSLLMNFSSRRKELSTAWLSDTSGYPRPTVHRLMATLAEIGWVVKTESGRWRLGAALFRLGSLAGDSFDLRSTVRPYLAELARQTGESSYLFVPMGERVLCLDRILGPGSIKVSMVDVGQTLPVTRGAAPLALLAFGNGSSSSEDGTELDSSLIAQLDEVRARGFALNVEELAPGVCAVGAPILDQNGIAIAAISLGGLRERFSDARLPEIGDELSQMAHRISMSLGFRGDWPATRDEEQGTAVEG